MRGAAGSRPRSARSPPSRRRRAGRTLGGGWEDWLARVSAGYPRPAMGAVWSDERRFQRWLDVELAVMAAWVELGVLPAEALDAVRERAVVDAARIGEIERR